MTPCIVTICNGKKRRHFFFFTGSFSIGTQMDDDLIICHPAFSGGSMKVVDGQVVRGSPDTENRIIHIIRLQLKFFLPLAVILGALCLAGMIHARTALSSRAYREQMIRPSENTGPMMSTGVRDVRIAAGLPKTEGGEAMERRMENVRSVLEDPMAGGRELSRCYLILEDGIRDAGHGDSENILTPMRSRIEERMRALLRRTVIESRSLIASGKYSRAMEEMDDLRAWVPGTWMDGRRELDEAESMFD